MNDLASLFMPLPNPLRQAERGRFYDPYGNTIDTTRPTVNNPDGSVSTERTITEQFNTPEGLSWINYPSIVGGKQLTPEAATDALFAGQNRPVGIFADLPTAERAAQQRTQYLGILEALGLLSNGARK